MTDWTEKDGRTNSSDAYLEAVREVQRAILSSGHALLNGNANGVARMIVSRLAMIHHLAPAASERERWLSFAHEHAEDDEMCCLRGAAQWLEAEDNDH